jgi:hypothetical protein
MKSFQEFMSEAVAGMEILTRSISFNDENGSDDYSLVKKIKWPYGVEVKYDDKNKKVTFKTAKMKTVAELLDKAVDFDTVSAGEVLELPPKLYAAYSLSKVKR